MPLGDDDQIFLPKRNQEGIDWIFQICDGVYVSGVRGALRVLTCSGGELGSKSRLVSSDKDKNDMVQIDLAQHQPRSPLLRISWSLPSYLIY